MRMELPLGCGVRSVPHRSILTQGEAQVGGAMLPPPDGVWGLPPDELAKVVGYGPDMTANRAAAQALMPKRGYSAQNPLKLKVSTRDIPQYRDPAVILIDQLKPIWIDGELEIIETSVYFNRVFQKRYVIGLDLTGSMSERTTPAARSGTSPATATRRWRRWSTSSRSKPT
jgi:peptide/nickel transport system substrate-binding protein